ncbi:MAG: glycerol kinase GlpK [Chloroflexi bacterium]|nr:glycerol kinase GlpK [Chloroflexota bacterium]
MTNTVVAAIDQGTTSTRCILFDRSGRIVALDQREHDQIFPQPGWVEHDALQIWQRTQDVVVGALAKAGLSASDVASVGITNQRETVVIWEKDSGRPISNAVVWQDTRSAALCAKLARDGGQYRFQNTVGLPLATYFSGPKIRWLLDNVPGARKRAARGELLFGTIDTWLVWNLTGRHVTDVTNASRTMLMNLQTLDWDPAMLKALGVPRAMLPEIRSSSEVYGEARIDALRGVPVAGILGDQQAALFGQACYKVGEAKNTYGTGCFMLLNTGTQPVISKNGLLTTLGYKLGDAPAVYALEGSIAIAGALVQWLRDNLGLIAKSDDVEALAATVADNGGIYFVPAFSGLYAPHWDDSARGIIAGLTRYVNRGHIARAALEATAFQTREVLDAMNKDSGVKLKALKVDGGMVRNEALMQFQSDVLNVSVTRPVIAETTALGAAYAAGLAVGYWRNQIELRANWQALKSWTPQMTAKTRTALYAGWQKAVQRTKGWTS